MSPFSVFNICYFSDSLVSFKCLILSSPLRMVYSTGHTVLWSQDLLKQTARNTVSILYLEELLSPTPPISTSSLQNPSQNNILTQIIRDFLFSLWAHLRADSGHAEEGALMCPKLTLLTELGVWCLLARQCNSDICCHIFCLLNSLTRFYSFRFKRIKFLFKIGYVNPIFL